MWKKLCCTLGMFWTDGGSTAPVNCWYHTEQMTILNRNTWKSEKILNIAKIANAVKRWANITLCAFSAQVLVFGKLRGASGRMKGAPGWTNKCSFSQTAIGPGMHAPPRPAREVVRFPASLAFGSSKWVGEPDYQRGGSNFYPTYLFHNVLSIDYASLKTLVFSVSILQLHLFRLVKF